MHARVPFLTTAVVAAPSTLSPQRCWCLVMSEREQGGAHTIYTCRTPRAGLTVGCSSESWLREQFANTPTSCVPSDVLSTRPTRCWTRGCTVRAGARVRVADWVCARDALSVRRALTAWRWDALAHALMSHDFYEGLGLTRVPGPARSSRRMSDRNPAVVSCGSVPSQQQTRMRC